MKYKCVFFDLDHTLWDYEANSRDTLHELFEQHGLQQKGIIQFEEFHAVFKRINQELWYLYDHGRIDSTVIREQRFQKILDAFNVADDRLANQLSQDYISASPKKGKLLPGAEETLQYLVEEYPLTVVTNGFDDVQHTKLASGKLTRYFKHIVTSERAGYKKPARQIFDFALAANGVSSTEAIMVGDNLLTDIAGARNAAVDAVFFNPEGVKHDVSVKHEIRSLKELCSLL
ncbi:MAG: noncanonical pyrimidine nucleotidase, YjjG family [Flammeovirgaceae bacterium]|nr:MAG: noncanonical pyrimidine nucleotidase, YjjG family [Flammeovirgaceae bacterium]